MGPLASLSDTQEDGQSAGECTDGAGPLSAQDHYDAAGQAMLPGLEDYAVARKHYSKAVALESKVGRCTATATDMTVG